MIRKGNTITLDFVWGLVGAPILFTVSPVTESDRTILPRRTRSSPTHCISCLANFWVVRALNSRSPIPRRRGDIVGNLNWNQATRTHTRTHAHTHTLAPPPVWVSTHARMNTRTHTHTLGPPPGWVCCAATSWGTPGRGNSEIRIWHLKWGTSTLGNIDTKSRFLPFGEHRSWGKAVCSPDLFRVCGDWL